MNSATKAGRSGRKTVVKRIYIIDPQPVVREGLVRCLESCPEFAVSGATDRAGGVLEKARRGAFDLVIMEIDLPDCDGLEIVKNLHALRSDLGILVFSRHNEALYADRAMRAGASGFLSKHATARRIVEAVRQVLKGQIYLSKDASAVLFESMAGRRRRAAGALSTLTDRELEVFRLIGEAHETREIASRLGMSAKTVEAHRGSIKRKLKLRSGPELTRQAVIWVERSA